MRTGFCSPATVAGLLLALALHAHGADRTLSRETFRDKIKGGWAGQMIGVAYGAPTEFKSNGKIGEWPLEWKAGMLENTLHQDDLYVEMTFAKVMDDKGLNATSKQFGQAFAKSKYQLWHANAGARRALALGIQPPWSGHPKYNFHANDIDFQIEADFIGLMCPGLPRASNRFCDRVGRVMNYGDGLYGGMFVCGMYSAAYFDADPRRIVHHGLACLPPQSGYARLISDLLEWSALHPNDWRHVWGLLQERWDINDPCPDGFQSPFNIDARLNGAYIAMGLLYGGGDFERTMEISTRCGQDSDCNPSSAAGVLGVVLGFEKIPAKFKEGFAALGTRKFSYTDYSFEDIVASTEKRALAVIRHEGGNVAAEAVRIPLQTAEPPRLEQWHPGIPLKRVPVADTAWTWTGEWTSTGHLRTAAQPGSEARLAFRGSSVAILGKLDAAGGQARVYLDGRLQKLPLDGWLPENTHDNILWQADALSDTDHTLRIVVQGKGNPHSKGKAVSLAAAVTYGRPPPPPTK